MKHDISLKKLEQAKRKWRLEDDGDIFSTRYSILQPVLYGETKAMLKIAPHAEDCRGFILMACWDGRAAVKILQFEGNAVLMERAEGLVSLREMVLGGNEDEANRIICSVAAKLHSSHCSDLPELVPLETWFCSLFAAADRDGGIFRQGAEVAKTLLAQPQQITALHGDIHYDNILDSGKSDWLSIDPKALKGERGFDFANLFCNPTPAIATSTERLKKQAKLIAGEAGIEMRRLLQWIAAWGGLSASWTLEDGEDPHVQLTVAQNALTELLRF